MERSPVQELIHAAPDNVVEVSFEPLPKLLPADIRNAAGVFLADASMLAGDYLQFADIEPEERQKTERAETLIHNFLASLYQLNNSEGRTPAAAETLALENIPENVFRAMLYLAKRIPEFRAALTEDPHTRFAGDHTTDYNPLYLAYRRSLDAGGRSASNPADQELRAKRLVRLHELREEDEQTIDRHQPFPIDVEKISINDIQRGATELHSRLLQEKSRLPAELQQYTEQVIDFLEIIISPGDAMRRADKEKQKREVEKLRSILERGPREFSFDVMPEDICESATRLKFADLNLNLTFMGHDVHDVAFGAISTPGGKKSRKDTSASLDRPLPFNPFNVAAANTALREREGEATLEELYRYDEFTKLQATHRSAIEIVSADQAARLVPALQGEGSLPLAERARRAMAILRRPIKYKGVVATAKEVASTFTELFFADQRRVRQERDDAELKKWQETIDSKGPDFYPIFPIIKQMAETMEKYKHLNRPKMIEAAQKQIENIFYNLCPYESGWSVEVATGYADLEKKVDHVKSLWEERYYFPNYLRGYVEKKGYRLKEAMNGAEPGGFIQMTPDQRMVVLAGGSVNEWIKKEGSWERGRSWLRPWRVGTQMRVTPFGLYTLFRYIGGNRDLVRLEDRDAETILWHCDEYGNSGGVLTQNIKSKQEQDCVDWFLQGEKTSSLLSFTPRLLKALPDGTLYGVQDNGRTVFVKKSNGELQTALIGADQNYHITDVYLNNDTRPAYIYAKIAEDNIIFKSAINAGKFSSFWPEHLDAKVLFQILPHDDAVYLNTLGQIIIKRTRSVMPVILDLSVVIPKPPDDEFTFAQMQPDGRIVAGTKKGKVLIYDGEPIEKKK